MSSLETRRAELEKDSRRVLAVSAGTPVALVDATSCFCAIRRPSGATECRVDVVVAGVVGDEADAQRAADTKITLLPATQKSRQLVRSWLYAARPQPLGRVLPPGESPGAVLQLRVPTAGNISGSRRSAVAANYVTATSARTASSGTRRW